MDSITTRYEEDKAAVRLSGPIDADSIIRLCDELWLAADYYQYRHIEIQINSPGGSTDALEYYLSQLELLHKRFGPRLVISTLALASVSSAAAIILAMGTIPFRRAYESSRLLFHYARFQPPESSVWTRNRLEGHSQMLATIDTKMISVVVDHIVRNKFGAEAESAKASERFRRMPVLEPNPDSMLDGREKHFRIGEVEAAKGKMLTGQDLREAYHRLYAADYQITAEMAASMFLIDEVIS